MTMATCPDGHQSVATDYCDECGLSIGAPPPIPTGGGSSGGSGPAAGGSGAGASVYGSAGEPCPNCLLPRQSGDTFCEGCGFDFANEQPAPTMTAPTLAGAGAGPQGGTGALGTSGTNGGASASQGSAGSDPMADLEKELRKAEEAARAAAQGSGNGSSGSSGASSSSSGQSGPSGRSAGPAPAGTSDPRAGTIAADPLTPALSTPVNGTAAGSGTATGWVAIASADRAYYDAVVAEGEIDPVAYPFPAYCPDRHFTLTGDTVRIGRTGKRGTVEIDLSGPPTDPGVSHLHAVFQRRPDGGWSVVDLESMNGTVLNDDTAPIPPNQAFPVEAGFRVHVGVWTTLTLIQTS
ncbi:MAG: FHA domain-containing protein [Catenulispora sp.]|nr:FHA domain-containing protein [Catenulispora sp.]